MPKNSRSDFLYFCRLCGIFPSFTHHNSIVFLRIFSFPGTLEIYKLQDTTVSPVSLVQGGIACRRFTLTREIRAAKTLAIFISALICCWFPFFAILMALFWCSTCFTRISPFINITFIYILPNISSALNPFIFFIFSQRLRKAFYKLYTRVKRSLICFIENFRL